MKPAAKNTAKAPTKAAAKPTSKTATVQEATKKDDAAKADKRAKPKKAKQIRDSFTMPKSEYDLIAAVKKRCQWERKTLLLIDRRWKDIGLATKVEVSVPVPGR